MENTHAPDDEIDLLDLLVTVAENIKLLIFGPLLAGLLALGVSFALPQGFESKAVVQSGLEVTTANGRTAFSGLRPEYLVAMAQTNVVLEPVLQQIDFLRGVPKEDGLSDLRERIKLQVGKNDKLLTITVTAPSADQALRINQALVNELFKQSAPRGEDLARLKVKLQFEKESLAQTAALEQELIGIIKSGKESDLLSATFVNVTAMKGMHFSNIQDLESQMLGVTASAMVQPPTLPDRSKDQKTGLMATLAALATGFALLLFVFVRKAWANAGSNPESAAKLAAIRRSLGLQ